MELRGVDLAQVARTAGPAVAGGILAGVTGYALAHVVTAAPLPAPVKGFIVANKEVLSLLLVVIGVWGRSVFGSAEFWVGWLVVAAMSLADNLMLRAGVDVG